MRPRTYWHTLVNSLTSAEYYREVLRAPAHFSLRFFLISIILLGLFRGYLWTSSVAYFVEANKDAVLQDAVTHFPKEGSLIWNGDRLTVTPDPFFIYTPEVISKRWPNLPPHLAILTSNPDVAPGELMQELSTTSLAVVTQNTLYVQGQNEWADISLARLLQDQLLLINQTTLDRHLEIVSAWVDSILPVVQVAGPVVTAIALILHRLWIAVIESILVFLLFRINQISLPFIKSYQLTLHLLVPAEFVHQAAHWLYPELQISLLSLSFWILLLFLFLTQRQALRNQFAHSTDKK